MIDSIIKYNMIIYNNKLYYSDTATHLSLLEQILKYKFPCGDVFHDFISNINVVFLYYYENNVLLYEQYDSDNLLSTEDIIYIVNKENIVKYTYLFNKKYGKDISDDNALTQIYYAAVEL